MAGGPQNSTDPRNASNMIDCDFSVDNLMDEIDGGGWLDTTRPEGVPEGELNQLHTVGGRGAESTPLRSDPRVRHNRPPID